MASPPPTATFNGPFLGASGCASSRCCRGCGSGGSAGTSLGRSGIFS